MGYIDELLSRAKADKKRIILPEPMDKRTFAAAEKLLAQDIADIIIIGTPEEIETYGAGYDISKATIVDPFNDPNKQKYIDKFVQLRGHKGVTQETAKLQMEQDYMYYACLMCKCGDADGAVSGACHSTGNTIRPALQLLKTKPGVSGVSGFFIMEVPDCELGENGLFVFADCAVNPDNDAQKMAETAGLSAENFEAFIGKKAKVALLSFSTKGSASHDRVTMVQEASELAKKQYPLYEIDGELQLDAALIPEIGEMKAPGSSVAGHANTLIFPDLESGNIGYKLVQRLAKANAYGPLLQGLSMPVNDLSRGCSADDIVATVAMTAIQAQMEDNKNNAKRFNIYGAKGINGQGDESMKILVVNCGSSSLKYQLIDAQSEEVLAKGLCERIGIEGSMFTYQKTGSDKITLQVNQPDHKTSISLVLRALTDKDHGVIGDLSEIGAVGHRLVHGGEEFSESTLITDEVIKAVESCNDLAPLHNPANIIGVNACRELMPETPMVGVFDTAFHQTMPPEAFIYGIPYEYYKKDKVRKYGFHGTSHAYVSKRTAEILGLDYDKAKIIVCHLGNGASICAVDGGKSVETSMGLTPLMGLVMGTRSGEIDPGVMEYLGKKENMSFEEIMTMLNKRSGVLGISGISSDFRDVDAAADDGNSQALLALQVYTHRVRSYIGSYIAVMNGVDAIVFTAGVGENDPVCRQEVIKNFGFIGAYIDEEKNNIRGKEAVISTDDSKVKVLVVPTNEELMIARDTLRIVNEQK